MKKVFYATIISIGFLIFYIQAKEIKPKSIELPELNLSEMPQHDPKITEIIGLINQKNNKITSAYTDNMPIKVSNSGITFRLNGELAFYKEKKFRLKIAHKITGKEMDLGSNNSIFWFWSRRINPPALYFSKHENLSNTNLKSALNPILMIESLNLSEIKIDGIKSCKKTENQIVIWENRQSPSNEILELRTFIDVQKNIVLEKNLLNQLGNKIVTTIYKENKIYFQYHEENTWMEWDMKNLQFNNAIPENYWQMPNMTQNIDIGI